MSEGALQREAKTSEQLSDNLEAASLVLTTDELKTLDEVSALPPSTQGG
jgi:aryl-alcohol dehydrogenase-like predicted oxidoreductase